MIPIVHRRHLYRIQKRLYKDDIYITKTTCTTLERLRHIGQDLSNKKKQSSLSCLCPEIQGGAVNLGLKRFFSLYRPLHLIEAYIRPEKYCFVWAGPLANHHSIITSFFLATVERRRRKERYVLRIWTAAFRSHSAATDGRRAAKLA